MKTMTSKTIGVNELLSVIRAARTLEREGLISRKAALKIYRQAKTDATCHLETYGGSEDLQRLCNDAYRLASEYIK